MKATTGKARPRGQTCAAAAKEPTAASRALNLLLAFVLAVGLMPLPAYAAGELAAGLWAQADHGAVKTDSAGNPMQWYGNADSLNAGLTANDPAVTCSATIYEDGCLVFATANGAETTGLPAPANAATWRSLLPWSPSSGNAATEYMDSVSSIEFGEGVAPTSLDFYFVKFNYLVHAPEIPSSVTSMNQSFNACASLQDAPLIPDGVAEVTYCFSMCHSLISLPKGFSLPNGIDFVDSEVFITTSDLYSSDNPLVTYCDAADYDRLSAYDWASAGRRLEARGGGEPQPTVDPKNAGNAELGGVNCAWSYGGNVTYAEGTGFTVTPYTAEGVTYVIDTLVVDGQAVDLTGVDATQPYAVASANSSVFATFAYTVNFNSPDGGTLTVARADGSAVLSGSVVRGGEILTISATPSEGYELDGALALTGLTAVDADAGTYRVTAVNGEPTPAITALFKEAAPEAYGVTVTLGANMTAAGGLSQTGLSGPMSEVVVMPDAGYGLVAPTVEPADAGVTAFINDDGTCTVSGTPTADVAVTFTDAAEMELCRVSTMLGAHMIAEDDSLLVQSVVPGASMQAVIVALEPGYKFAGEPTVDPESKVSGVRVGGSEYDRWNVYSSCVLESATVTFPDAVPIEWNATVIAGANTTVAGNASQTGIQGVMTDVTVKPAEGYRLPKPVVNPADSGITVAGDVLSGWTVGGMLSSGALGTDVTVTFADPDPVSQGADAWDGTADTSWYVEGRQFYDIYTAAQLAGFRDLVNSGGTFEGATVRLHSDLEMNSSCPDGQGDYANWTPIGAVVAKPNGTLDYQGKRFSGTFDGGGHVVSNLYAVNDLYSGLFGYVPSATVTNVGVTGYIEGSSTPVAGGYSSGARAAGIACAAQKVGCCFNAATVKGADQGIGGIASEWTEVEDSYNVGRIIGSGSIGGISGLNSRVARSYNAGLVSNGETSDKVCAVVGLNQQINPNTGDANQDSYITGSLWLEGTAGYGAYYYSSQGGSGEVTNGLTRVDSAGLAASASALGGAFKADANGVNGGYPLLYWQDGGEADAGEHALVFSAVDASTGGALSGFSVSVEGVEGSGPAFSLPNGSYSYTVTLDGYAPASGSVTVNREDAAVEVALSPIVAVTVSVDPAGASFSIADADGAAVDPQADGSYLLVAGREYSYSASAEGCYPRSGEFTASDGLALSVVLDREDDFDGLLHGGETVEASGRYRLANDATGTITVEEGLSVEVVGSSYDHATGSFAGPVYNDLTIRVGDGSALTLRDAYFLMSATDGGTSFNAIDFLGEGTLLVEGVNLLDRSDLYDSCAMVHVGPSASVTLGGSGTLYGYKHAQGAFVGANGDESNGAITFESGTWLLKGSKTGAVIGTDTTKGGPVTVNGGEIYVKSVSRGAVIGGSAQGEGLDVTVNGGMVQILTDWSGSAIGYGGGMSGDPGTLTVNGGSLMTVVTPNAYGSWGIDAAEEWGGVVTPVNVTAATGAAMLRFPTDAYAGEASIEVEVDGEPFYSGAPRYAWTANEEKNPTAPYSPSTLSNWLPNEAAWATSGPEAYSGAYPAAPGARLAGESALYLWLPAGADHVLAVGGDTYDAAWDGEAGTWALTQREPEPAKSGWVNEDGTWRYYYGDGTMATSKWMKDDSGEWCFLGADGARYEDRWAKDSKSWYYMGADGHPVKSKWMKDSHDWVYLGADGAMVTNKWAKDSKHWYYMGSDGYMVKSKWQKDSKDWCYLGSDGAMYENRWAKDSKHWYFMGADGHPVKSKWQKDSAGWCYLGSDGAMVTSAWQADSKGWCYLDAGGHAVTGAWKKVDGTWYYFDGACHMVTGTQIIDGKTYTFDGSGAWTGR